MRLAALTVFLSTTALVPIPASAQPQGQQPAIQQRQAAQQQNQQGQGLRASQLREQTLYTQSGQQIGRVNTLVQGRDNQAYAVVASANGQVLVPVNRLAYRNDRFILSGNVDQRQLEVYNQQVAAQYREVDPEYRVAIVGYEVDPVVVVRRPAGDGTNVVVRQAAPTVRVDPADPRVIVRQQQPQVTVNQAQPEIIVRQPQPTVRVDIPQPEIIVRMPQPDVNVAVAQPDVRVLMERPDVSVVQPGQPQVQVGQVQPQVMLQRSADLEPNVQVQQAEGQPTVRYERAQPRVIVNQAEGQPNVQIERQGQANVRVQQQDRTGTGLSVATFDRDRNNTLVRDEFNPFVDRVYTGWDANRNQRLERNEFYGGLYNVWDINLDARLTEDEYNQAWDTWGTGLNDIEFGEFDRNDDGFLDRNEFAGGWGDNGLYERWDADRTGGLAENEFGNGLFGLWGERDQIATNEFQPWVGRNWGISGTQRAGADVNTFEPRYDPVDSGAAMTTGAVDATANVRPFRVSALEDMDVYSLRGQQIGEVKRVVRRIGDNQGFVILEHGGFLGLGEKEVPLPMNRVFMMGDRLVAAGMTETEVNAMRDWDFNEREYTEVGDHETVEIGLRG